MGVEGLCKMFQLRNPQLYVIGAYIHLDEETPHLHLNLFHGYPVVKEDWKLRQALRQHLLPEDLQAKVKGTLNGSNGQRRRKMILLLL